MKINLFKDKTARSKILIGGILLVVGLLFVAGVYAQTQQELEDELNQLESELFSAGYSWLVDYSGVKN